MIVTLPRGVVPSLTLKRQLSNISSVTADIDWDFIGFWVYEPSFGL